ncbi:RNA polymerase sigma factor [Caulobacter sp. KR2-114]|uniref:RNA polymerase sigma factor n=1 Tax=Caulobacter sp. KR2-114 TaxID=3400912 RepID=UPI003C126068
MDAPRTQSRVLEDLFKRHHRWLAAVLKRRYGAEAAEDLAQETYLKLARRQGDAAIQHPRALLMHVAKNLAIDQNRRARREVEASASSPETEVLPTPPQQQQALLLKQIVLALPPKLRDVFVLNQIEGLTHQEIARLRGISVKTVEWRMRKALAQCVAAMKD